VHALADAGRLAEAAERAAQGRELAVQDRSAIGRIWSAYHLGRCALLAGRIREARRWFAEAVAVCRDHGYPWPRRLAVCAFAAAAGAGGDARAARRAVTEAAGVGDIGYLRAEQELGPAWAAVAAGDVAAARHRLLTAADDAAASGHFSSEAWLRHDVVRLGDPATVRDRLAELGGRCEGPLVVAYAAHAGACAAQDPDALAGVIDTFEAMGALLYAAEAAITAGRAAQRRGAQRTATKLYARGAALAARCEGARTPALVPGAGVVPLTRREREVAALAVQGCSSREIAAQLHLSVRTVDNHLQNAYAKLGVSRRNDLAAALAGGGVPEPANEPP
jgi:DNA-binding CsgD family transcriptional regulator